MPDVRGLLLGFRLRWLGLGCWLGWLRLLTWGLLAGRLLWLGGFARGAVGVDFQSGDEPLRLLFGPIVWRGRHGPL